MLWLQPCLEWAISFLNSIFCIVDWLNFQFYGRIAAACGVRRPRDFACPPPNKRLQYDIETPLAPKLVEFQKLLSPTEVQHGNRRGDGDPMLYLYMEKALRTYPSLAARVTRNKHLLQLSDEELFSIPARDTHVSSAMYNRTGCNSGSYPFLEQASAAEPAWGVLGRCLDLRDWASCLALLCKQVTLVLIQMASLVGSALVGDASKALSQPPSQPAAQGCTSHSILAQWAHTAEFDSNPLFSFSGAAWLIIYHVGAASALQERWALSAPSARLCGTSSGSVVATCTGAGLQLSDLIVRSFEKWLLCNQRVCGPVGCMGELVLEAMTRHLPEDGHKQLSDRVKIAVSALAPLHGVHAGNGDRVPAHEAGALFFPGLERGWLHPAHVSHFESKADVTAAVLASCYIPLYSDVPGSITRSMCHAVQPDTWASMRPPSCAGEPLRSSPVVCWDGGLTSNYPRWFGQQELKAIAQLREGGTPPDDMSRFTVTVSPTRGEATISPGRHASAHGAAAEQQGVHGVSCTPAPCAGRNSDCGRGCGGGEGRGFVVDAALCAEGWGPDETLIPMTPERWWAVFFAGRAHAQAWMQLHGFGATQQPVNA